MKKKNVMQLLVVASLVVASSGTLNAQGKFGLGFIFGDPTGFSWKYKISGTNAIDGVVGFSPFNRFRVHVDYLWNARSFSDPNFLLYYGVGGELGFGRTEYVVYRGRYAYFDRYEPMSFGARGVVGISYSIPRSPVELMLEAAPILVVAPVGGIGIDAGVGVRVYP